MAEIQNTGHWEIPSASEPVKNIVLVGVTGNGKSATANSIIGKYTFESRNQAVGVTEECQTFRTTTTDGPIINIIDTPGLFDPEADPEFICKEIVSCLYHAKEGLHAVVLVLSLSGRISKEEESALSNLQMLFGSEIIDYLIVLFTSGDTLKENGTLDDYFSRGCPKFLKEVFKLCGDRRLVFDNKTTDEGKKAKQVHELLFHIAAVEKKNGGRPYTDKMHRRIQDEAEKKRKLDKEIEERDIAEEEKAKLKKLSEMAFEQNLKVLSQMMETTLKEITASNERQMIMMKEILNSKPQSTCISL